MFSITKIIQTLFILFIAFAESSCSESLPYPTLDSGAGVDATGREPIEWLDNHRVIYKGYSGPKPPPNKEGGWSPVDWGLFIWDTRTNETKRYADGAKVCYHDGYIYYQVKGREPVTKEFPHRSAWMEGPFGKETYHQIKYSEGKKPDDQFERSRIDCKLYPNDNHKMYLLGADEYIEIIRAEFKKSELYFRSDQRSIRKRMLLEYRDLSGGGIRYYPFQNCYLAYSPFPRESCRQGKCMPLWWINREGDTEKALIPIQHEGGSIVVRPVKTGYFVERHATPPVGGGI